MTTCSYIHCSGRMRYLYLTYRALATLLKVPSEEHATSIYRSTSRCWAYVGEAFARYREQKRRKAQDGQHKIQYRQKLHGQRKEWGKHELQGRLANVGITCVQGRKIIMPCWSMYEEIWQWIPTPGACILDCLGARLVLIAVTLLFAFLLF